MNSEHEPKAMHELTTPEPTKAPLHPAGSAASELQPLVKELRALADGWRNSPSDPHNIANAVMVALLEVSNAIVRAYGEPPNTKLRDGAPETPE